MSTAQFRSARAHQEISLQSLFRDTRPASKRFFDMLGLPRVAGGLYLLGIVALLAKPVLFPVIGLIAFILWLNCLGRHMTLPFNLPFVAKEQDQNDLKPGRSGFNKAAGMFLVGNVMETFEELWLNFSTLLRHILVFGTTGSGKTETLVSMAANFIATGAGVIYNDAKAAPKLAWQLYTIARYFGRDDDFLMINYLTGNVSSKPDPAVRLSNDSAPFAFGSPEASTQLVLSLMPKDPGGSNKVFSDRAVALISAIMPSLTELRDKGLLMIDPDVVRSHMEYERTCSLLSNPHISPKARRAIVAFMRAIPGYDETKPPNKQGEEVTKQFGFAQSYFTRSLSSLSDTYGHIYMVGAGEVDFQDVILNDRILCTLLPSMEKSGDELANLGKLILSALRNAMATGLGSQIEGEKEDILDSLPTATNRPFGIINDEYAYMAVEDFAITAAQGRGLNFVMVFAGQDYAGFKRASEREAEQIVANCRFKYIMALEDGGSTLDLVKNIVSDTWVSMTQGSEASSGLGLSQVDSLRASAQRVARIDPQDLRKLDMGEGFGIYQDKVVLLRNFWHGFTDDDLCKYLPINRRLLVERPERGPYATVLDVEVVSDREANQIWLSHLDGVAIDASILTPPVSIAGALEALYAEDANALSPLERGLYFTGYAIERAGGNNEASAGDMQGSLAGLGSLLSNAEGDFANELNGLAGGVMPAASGAGSPALPDADDATIQAAIQQVTNIFASLPVGDEGPWSEGGAEEHPHDDGDGAIDDSDPLADSESLYNTLLGRDATQRVVRGVARIEKALGADESSARDSAVRTAQALKTATEYPNDPTPQREDADPKRLAEMLQRFMAPTEAGSQGDGADRRNGDESGSHADSDK